ncbi:MAG TPA: plastocyanin/azurin family copper-binding protein [Solirubrobacteraceae bacterium]|nr:plastocyanin/azurin family copper-binding protein [Solirubrobacteraceae bacterium]
MHTLAVQLAPILAEGKSKVPFFVAGGLLVAWALFVSLGLGLRNPDFPGNLGGQRIVSAITAVLVLAAASTAIIVSGGEGKTPAEAAAAAAAAKTQTSFDENTPDTAAPEATGTTNAAATTPASSTPTTTSSTPASSTPTASTPAASTPAKKTPKATTGTPAPPSSPAAAATTTLKLAANPAGQLAYDTKQLSAKAGKVTIEMTNMSPVEHDVAVAQGTTVVGQTPVFTGGSKAVTLTLKPGTYTFYCTVPGHRQAGMEGTLTVS